MRVAMRDSSSQPTQVSDRLCVAASFKTQQQVNQAIRQLFKQGIPRNDISAVGKNIRSETRIAGFLTKQDVILDGLKSGAIFGSLFGTFLGLLSNIGVLFVPFVGPVVVAGPLGAALLGATSRAIADSTDTGLASALAALGMPSEKAARYEICLHAGEFLLIVEVLHDQSDEIHQLLEQIGGQDIAVCDEMSIPRQPDNMIEAPAELSPEIRSRLSEDAQQTFIWAYNEAFLYSQDAEDAILKAWNAVEATYQKDENGCWATPKSE
jgi:cation transport regulator ChaB/uncharacterized membrane protein